jgi:hypothetical protein
MLFKFLFPLLFFAGFYFLIKSIGRILAVYSGKKIEFPANEASVICKFSKPGTYEIAYKRRTILGVVPTDVAFTFSRQPDGTDIIISKAVNVLGSRKDMSGNRIIPVAEFSIAVSGNYELNIPEIRPERKATSFLSPKKQARKAS